MLPGGASHRSGPCVVLRFIPDSQHHTGNLVENYISVTNEVGGGRVAMPGSDVPHPSCSSTQCDDVTLSVPLAASHWLTQQLHVSLSQTAVQLVRCVKLACALLCMQDDREETQQAMNSQGPPSPLLPAPAPCIHVDALGSKGGVAHDWVCRVCSDSSSNQLQSCQPLRSTVILALSQQTWINCWHKAV